MTRTATALMAPPRIWRGATQPGDDGVEPLDARVVELRARRAVTNAVVRPEEVHNGSRWQKVRADGTEHAHGVRGGDQLADADKVGLQPQDIDAIRKRPGTADPHAHQAAAISRTNDTAARPCVLQLKMLGEVGLAGARVEHRMPTSSVADGQGLLVDAAGIFPQYETEPGRGGGLRSVTVRAVFPFVAPRVVSLPLYGGASKPELWGK